MNDPAASCEVSIRWNSSSYRSKLRGIRPEEIKFGPKNMARWQGFRELKTERAPLAIRPEIGLIDELLVALLVLEGQVYSGAEAHYHAFFDF